MTAGHKLVVEPAWLERVNACPVCGGKERAPLASGMKDINYGVVDGDWQFFRCLSCRSAFLDPRIDAAHIADAYAHYETHSTGAAPPARKGLGQLLRNVAHAYSSRRYGFPESNATFWPGAAVYLLPPLKLERDFDMRHSVKGSGHAVLDVGCGNGAFLFRMSRAGWVAHGIDFDPEAVATAKAQGLNVRLSSLAEASHLNQAYDLVSASHVIEHVHDPAQFLKDLYARVKPGGRLWLATPNIDSPLRRREGAYWCNWETPRHLQMFSAGSLGQLIYQTLGCKPKFRRRGWHMYWSMAQSHRLASGEGKGERPRLRGWVRCRAWLYELFALLAYQWGDELVVEIRKPRE